MAAFVPFEADVVASATGFTQVVISTSPTQVTSSLNAPVLYVANLGGAAFIRIDKASTTAAAIGTDIALPAGAVRLFANPAPAGTCNVTVVGVTVSNSMVFVTPGQGGI